jgi:galactose mutarotase-like enzyme
VDALGIPTGESDERPAERFALGSRTFDDGYDRIPSGGAFSVSGAGRAITMTQSTGYPVAQVYSPRDAAFICFEPMTAPVDALRTGSGLRRATEGHPFSAVFSISVRSAP